MTKIPSLEVIASAVQSGAVTCGALTTMALKRIERLNPELNAFVYVDTDGALAAAAEIDARIARGEEVGPLAGLPFAVKDLDDAAGMPTAKGSRWFAGRGPVARDDIHVERLRAAGAVPIGKTATPEFGASGFCTSLVHGTTRNPWDHSRTPGGSSGGSAAAVSTGMVPFATASDGAGSIRTPAAFTGLPGLRPGYGRVPSFASNHLAQNAVNFALAPSVADTALLLDVCVGEDRRDRTSLPSPAISYRSAIKDLDVRGLRIAFSLNYGIGEVDHEVAGIVIQSYKELCAAAGLEPVEVDVTLPFLYDTSSKVDGVDRWIGLADGLWPERAGELNPMLQQRWELSSKMLVMDLGSVYTARRRIEHQVARLFDEFDVLVTPATGVAPFAAEGPYPDRINGVPGHPFVGLSQPIMPSLCNLPAISVPAGLTGDGLPVGMQIIASLHREDVCLRLAYLYEQAQPWLRHPANEDGFATLFA